MYSWDNKFLLFDKNSILYKPSSWTLSSKLEFIPSKKLGIQLVLSPSSNLTLEPFIPLPYNLKLSFINVLGVVIVATLFVVVTSAPPRLIPIVPTLFVSSATVYNVEGFMIALYPVFFIFILQGIILLFDIWVVSL